MVLIDDLSTQRYSSLFNLDGPTRYRFLHGDVTSHLDNGVLAGADAVIHLAGTTDPLGSVLEPSELFGNNLRITKYVADTCADAGVPVIFTSSTSVYTTTQAIVDENSTDLAPVSPYAKCKLMEEDYLLRRMGPEGCLVFRLGTIFGVSPGMRFHTAVNKFCWQAATGMPIEVWSTAMDQTRPYLAVGDAAAVITRAAIEGIRPGCVINAVTCNVTVRQVLEAIRACGMSPKVKLIDSSIMNTLSFSTSIDAAHALGFTFRGDLLSGVRETLATLGHLG
jgi:nucleoside-diphosphate-sugar epimerase